MDQTVKAPEVEPRTCDEHCDEFHSTFDTDAIETDRDRLREVMRNMIEAYHRGHDLRFPWSLCSWETCRDVAIALGVRP